MLHESTFPSLYTSDNHKVSNIFRFISFLLLKENFISVVSAGILDFVFVSMEFCNRLGLNYSYVFKYQANAKHTFIIISIQHFQFVGLYQMNKTNSWYLSKLRLSAVEWPKRFSTQSHT